MAENIPRRLVFRIPGVAQVGVAFLLVCMSVVALAGPMLWLLYLIPIGLGIWVWRTRTVVDTQRIAVRHVLYTQVIDWSALAGLRVREHKWVRAVLADGREIALPSVRPQHLPALALFSGGRLADPTEKPASGAANPEADTKATSEAPSPAREQSTTEEVESAPETTTPAPPVDVTGEAGATI